MNKKGFTLIELLVVIAIIGILSSVVLVSLNDARGKARIAQAQGSLNGVTPAAVICLDNNKDLNPAVEGALVCPGSSAKWPVLPSTDWHYNEATTTSSFSSGTFKYAAWGDGRSVTCSESGCVTE